MEKSHRELLSNNPIKKKHKRDREDRYLSMLDNAISKSTNNFHRICCSWWPGPK